MKSPTLGRTLKLLNAFLKDTQQFIGQQLTGETYNAVMSYVYTDLFPKAKSEALWALQKVVKRLEGSKVTKERLLSLGAYILQEIPTLAEGINPPLWDGRPAHAVMTCIGVTRDQEHKDRLVVHTFCLQGDPAGLFFAVSLSRNMLEYVLGKKLGVSFKTYNAEAEEIAGCYFKCIVSEDTARSYFSSYEATPKMKTLNKELADRRVALMKCHTPRIPCNKCKATRATCKLAVWKGTND